MQTLYFKTISGSSYYVNLTEKTICGGALGNVPCKFHSYSGIITGTPAIFKLADGRTMKTSSVIGINLKKGGNRYGSVF